MCIHRMTAALLGIVWLAACSNHETAGTGRTERERDSLIGQSKVPGGSAVKRALDVADSSHNRIAREDSAAAAP
jgi:hypothetical protein